MKATEDYLRFAPSRVEGLPDVTEVAIFPGRLELCSAGRWLVYRFEDIAEWPRPAWLWQLFARLGWRPPWLPVGERDWFHPPPGRFFRFFTRPRVVVFLPDEPAEMGYASTLFVRIQRVMRTGGFDTWDLG